MPYYKKRSYSRKRSYPRRNFKRRYATASMRLQKRAGLFRAGASSPEVKSVYNTSLSLNTSVAGACLCFTQIAQGLDSFERIGDKVTIKGFNFRIHAIANSASTTGSTVRLVGFIMPELNGALPNPSMILQNAAVINSLIRSDNALSDENFTVIFDKILHIPAASQDLRTIDWKYFKKFNMVTSYIGTTNAIGDCNKNHLCILSMSSSAANTPLVFIDTRLRYIDP